MVSLWNCAAGYQLIIINQSRYLHAGLHKCVKLGTWFETVSLIYFQLGSSTVLFPYSWSYRYFSLESDFQCCLSSLSCQARLAPGSAGPGDGGTWTQRHQGSHAPSYGVHVHRRTWGSVHLLCSPASPCGMSQTALASFLPDTFPLAHWCIEPYFWSLLNIYGQQTAEPKDRKSVV